MLLIILLTIIGGGAACIITDNMTDTCAGAVKGIAVMEGAIGAFVILCVELWPKKGS